MSNWARCLLSLFIVAFIFGCATPYQKQGARGGFTESRLDKNTLSIAFKGNGYTGSETVQRYMFYRCAEATIEYGFDYFILMDSDSSQENSTVTTAGHYVGNTTASVYGSGNYAYGNSYSSGTYYPGQTIPITKFGATALVKMFNGTKPANNPTAFDAHEVVRYMGPSIPGAKAPASTAAATSEIDESTLAAPTQQSNGKPVAALKTEARWHDAAEFSAEANSCTASLRMIGNDDDGNELYESACRDGKKLKMQCVKHGCVVKK